MVRWLRWHRRAHPTDMFAAKRIILISGLPASGKSSYCRWLHAARDYVHVDLDQDLRRGAVSLPSMLDSLRRSAFSAAIDWGFHPHADFQAARCLTREIDGFWWFDGDREAARQRFCERRDRGEHPATLDDFERQLDQINSNWTEIENLFRGRIIRSILPGPRNIAPEVIFAQMV